MTSVLITGASRGIGRASALALDRAGHDVIAGVRDEEAGRRLAAEASGRLRIVNLDVTDHDSVQAAAEAAGDRLDALVNNAGIAVGGVVEALDLGDLRRQARRQRRRTGRGDPSAAARAASCFGTRCVHLVSVRSSLGAGHDALHRLEVRAGGHRRRAARRATPLGRARRPRRARFDRHRHLARCRRAVLGDARRSEEHRRLYDGLLTGSRKLIRATAKRAAPAEKVVKVVEQAVTAPRPRTPYVVGADARGQILMRTALPDRAFDAVVARMTGAG